MRSNLRLQRLRVMQRVFYGALFCAPFALHATTFSWTNLGIDNNWEDAGNWDPSNALYPGVYVFPPYDTAVLPAMSQGYSIELARQIYVGDITVDAPYSIDVRSILEIYGGVNGSGLTVTVVGSLIFAGASANAGSTMIDVNNGGFVGFVSNADAGTAAITSAGRVAFDDLATGANASVILNSGSLDVSAMTVALSLNALNDTLASPGSIILGNNSLTVANALNQTFYGSVSGAGTLAYAGAGSFSLEGNNSGFTGELSVQEGELHVDADFGTASVIVDSGGTLRGAGRTGALTLLDGTLSPGSGVGTSLRVASLTCSTADITIDLDAGTRLVVDQALTVAQCPQWHLTLKTVQPIASGHTFDVATLSSGTDYDVADIVVAPPPGYVAHADRFGNDIIVKLYDASDAIFANAFD